MHMTVFHESFGREKVNSYSCHPAINDEIRTINKAALIASEEKHGLRLLNSFTKAPSGKVYFTAMAFWSVITEPVLEEGCTVYKIIH